MKTKEEKITELINNYAYYCQSFEKKELTFLDGYIYTDYNDKTYSYVEMEVLKEKKLKKTVKDILKLI
jgi:hypothetical protein